MQVWRFAEYEGFGEEGFVYFYAETGLIQNCYLAGFYFWLYRKDCGVVFTRCFADFQP